ncbi:MAG: hypothetical protein JWN20_668 [Jatrophihabitantaceae bacterium]|nr:hypothetical protein [Jatrophihabitantaceae bacterium]
MQTFLPYTGFEQSARALDTKRLGKQRVEVIQIVRALVWPKYAWKNHPATLMWKGHEEALGRYGLTMCAVWCERGFADTCAATIAFDLAESGVAAIRSEPELIAAGAMPTWLGDEALHLSHRSSLLAKDPGFYGGVFGPDVVAGLPYVWPVRSPGAIEAERRKAAAAARRAAR